MYIMGRIYSRSVIFVDSRIKKDNELVNLVKKYPIIFNKSNPLHFNSTEREQIWRLIAENVGSTAQICEERWNHLVEAYIKCIKGQTIMHETLLDQLDECLLPYLVCFCSNNNQSTVTQDRATLTTGLNMGYIQSQETPGR